MPRSTDTFMKVAPNGTITFEFTGTIRADGLTLTTSISNNDSDPSFNGLISWLNSLLPTPGGQLWANDDTPNPSNPGGTGDRQVALQLPEQSARSNYARLALKQQGIGGGVSDVVEVTADVRSLVSDPVRSRRVIAGDDTSSFLSFPPTLHRTHKINYGHITYTWPGAVGNVTVNVNHGLGVVPVIVLLTAGNNGILPVYRVGGFTLTQFTINVLANVSGGFGGGGVPGAGVQDDVYWQAIG